MDFLFFRFFYFRRLHGFDEMGGGNFQRVFRLDHGDEKMGSKLGEMVDGCEKLKPGATPPFCSTHYHICLEMHTLKEFPESQITLYLL